MANFPTGIPSYSVTAGADTPNGTAGGIGLTGLLNDFEIQIPALATKLGTGASTPTAGLILQGNGVGTSAWTATPTVSSFTNANHTHADTANGGQLSATAFPNNAITAPLLSTSAIRLGYKQTSASDQTGITATTLLNLSSGTSLNYTVPAGGRDVMIYAQINVIQQTSTGGETFVIRDGATTGATAITIASDTVTSGSAYTHSLIGYLAAPAAGSRDVCLTLGTSAGTVDVRNTVARGYILVLAI